MERSFKIGSERNVHLRFFYNHYDTFDNVNESLLKLIAQ